MGRWVYLSRTPRWDPAKHPRDPLGRFSLVAGGAHTRHERGDIGIDTMEEEIAAGRFNPARREAAFGNGAAPSEAEEWGDLSPISNEVRWRIDQRAFRGDSAEFAEMIAMVEREEMGLRTNGQLMQEWAGARKRRQEEAQRWEPIPSPPAASSLIVRDDEAEPSYQGYEGHTRAMVETDLARNFDPDGGLNEIGVQDLSDGGAMNRGVRRARLQEGMYGPIQPTEVVVKRASTPAEASAEILSSELGRAIGAPMPVVIGNPADNVEIGMEAIPGSLGHELSLADLGPRALGAAESRRYREGAARIALLDQLTGNRDRHDGNWILTDDGVPVAIDNGLAFSAGEGRDVRVVEETRRIQQFMETNASQKAGSWQRYTDRIPDEEIKAMGPKIMALRPLFEVHERADWYEGVLSNWMYLYKERLQR